MLLLDLSSQNMLTAQAYKKWGQSTFLWFSGTGG